MPEISVIVPVYNAAKHIITCIDSLLSQTLPDLEVILIDDHGSDGSIDLVKKHIENHEKKNIFRFFETGVNSGPGEARNIGIKMAAGEYLAFVDSDDWIEPDMYSELYEAAKKQNADLCCCQAWQDDALAKKPRVLKLPAVEQGSFIHENKAYFLANYTAYFWTFIYKRDFLYQNKIIFPPEKTAEDSYFIACSILCAKRLSRVDKPLYHYVIHSDSLSRQKNDARCKNRQKVFERLFDFAEKQNLYVPFQAELDYIYIKKAYITGAADYIGNAEKASKNVLKALKISLEQQIPDYKKNRYYRKNKKARLAVFLLQRFPGLCTKVLPCMFRKIFR